jgi:hypothetical protein
MVPSFEGAADPGGREVQHRHPSPP